jgi:D-arabinono-1,4-lactone oxidase
LMAEAEASVLLEDRTDVQMFRSQDFGDERRRREGTEEFVTGTSVFDKM